MHNLHAYAFGLFRKVYYKVGMNERSKSFKDYVKDAIERHIAGLDNFDPSKSPLEYHLKFNVIRQAIYNDRTPYEKKKAEERKKPLEESNITPLPTRRPSEPSFKPSTSEMTGRHDENLLFNEIEKAINGDDIMERIYLAVFKVGFEFSDRAEICKEYGLTASEFDNGKRRLMTASKSVVERLKIE